MLQSQHSQFSDVYTSSLYDADDTGSLPIIQSDDFIPDISFGQQSFSSVTPSITESDHVQPLAPPLPVPTSLQRACPDRITTYVIYSEMAKDDFVSWWLQTDYGRKKQIRWNARQQSDVWKNFDQVANAKDGTPRVMCKRCKKVLDHPQQHRNGNGTSAMIKHLKGIGCRGSQSSGIKQFLQEVISIPEDIYYLANIYSLFTDISFLKTASLYTGGLGE